MGKQNTNSGKNIEREKNIDSLKNSGKNEILKKKTDIPEKK